MERGMYRGYYPEPYKYLIISDTMGQEKAVRQEFAMEGIDLKILSGSRYLEAYLGQQEELEA